MKHWAVLISLLWEFASYAQPTFKRLYDGSGTLQMIELESGNLFTGLTYQNGTSIIDPNGNILQSKSHVIDTLLGISSYRPWKDNEFFFVSGYHKDSCFSVGSWTFPYTHPAIGKMDSLGNVLAIKHYPLANSRCWGYPKDLAITDDKSVITWGAGGPGLTWSFYALNVDSTLAPLWARSFNNHGSFQFIKELPSGDLLAGINMDTAGAVVARMDANGNFLWCKSYIRPRGMVHDVVIESDSSFIITGFTDSTASTNPFIPLPPDFHPKLFMLKLNGAGEVQWCKGYDSDPYRWYTRQSSRIERTLNGHYVILATLGYPGYNFFYRPSLLKTDLNGDTLWTRSVGASGFDYYTVDLLAYSDGGFLIGGIVWGDLPGNNSGMPYIFKTDSLGHFPCLERVHTVEVTDFFPVDSSFTLTSVDGATMMPAFVSDTVYDPISEYDACIVTAVQKPTEFRRSRVYPNPTTGRITVEFDDPLERDSFYSVYDELGRLLYQRPLPPGRENEEIDLSRFGKGAYVLRFTLPDSVRHERVVLE